MEGANYTVMMASKLAGSTKPELLTKHRLAAETQKRLDLDMIYKVCMCVYAWFALDSACHHKSVVGSEQGLGANIQS